MKKVLFVVACCILSTAAANAQQAFGPWIDASQFDKADICLDIQAAIAALPAVTGSSAPSGVLRAKRSASPTGEHHKLWVRILLTTHPSAYILGVYTLRG
jgi:hypothetical protein